MILHVLFEMFCSRALLRVVGLWVHMLQGEIDTWYTVLTGAGHTSEFRAPCLSMHLKYAFSSARACNLVIASETGR